MRLGIMIILTLVLAVMATIVVIAVAARDRTPVEDAGVGTLRRVFLLVLSSLALLAAGNGLAWLLASLLAAAAPLRDVNDTTLALGVAFSVVGIPSYLGFWGATRRALREHPIETTFLARQLTLHAVRAGAAFAATIALAALGAAALGVGTDDWPAAAARVLVWGGVAWQHHRLVQQERPTHHTGRVVHALLLDALGTIAMVSAAIAVAEALTGVLAVAHDALHGLQPLRAFVAPDGVRVAFGSALAFGFLWALVERENGPQIGGVTRAIATYAFGIAPAVIAVVAAAGVALFEVIDLLPGGEPRAWIDRTAPLPGVIAVWVVAGGVWAFHAARARREASTDPTRSRSGERTTLHLIALVGLITAAVGLGHAFAALIWVWMGGVTTGIGSPLREGAILGVTLLTVGLPTWAWPWWTLQRWAAAEPMLEGRALARRVYLLLTLLTATATVMGAAGTAAFMWMERALAGSFALAWSDARVWFATAAAAAVVAGYHAWVWRGDARRAALQR